MQVEKINNQSFGMRNIKVDDEILKYGLETVKAVKYAVPEIRQHLGGKDTDLFISTGYAPQGKRALVMTATKISEVMKKGLFAKPKLKEVKVGTLGLPFEIGDVAKMSKDNVYENVRVLLKKLDDKIEAEKVMEEIKKLCDK